MLAELGRIGAMSGFAIQREDDDDGGGRAGSEGSACVGCQR